MQFRQPNSLARSLHQVINELVGGEIVSLRFDSEAQLQHVLTALAEVAQSRQVQVQVTTTGPRTLELRLTEISQV